jgi:hypothetical protein
LVVQLCLFELFFLSFLVNFLFTIVPLQPLSNKTRKSASWLCFFLPFFVFYKGNVMVDTCSGFSCLHGRNKEEFV